MHLPGETSTSLRSVWSASSTVIQPPSKATKVPRIKAKELPRRLYRLGHLSGFDARSQSAATPLCDVGMDTAGMLPPPPPVEGALAGDRLEEEVDPLPLQDQEEQACTLNRVVSGSSE